MGLLRKAQEYHRRLRRVWSFPRRTDQRFASVPVDTALTRFRSCRFEQMEPRCLLAAGVMPLQIGAVYYEDASGVDEAGDLFEVTFSGGAPGTQLAELAIQTDKSGDGLTIGDVFFDIDSGGLGAFMAVPLNIVERSGIDSLSASVSDGGTSLVFSFSGFDPGDRLIFSIDVDEQGFLGPNAVAEGNELEGSRLTATLVAPHYFDAQGNDIFIDYYQQKLDDSGLVLPPDDYVPPGDVPTPVRTAAAVFPLTQTPLPITVAGTVFEDLDLDNTRDPGEPGLPGVGLTLIQLQGKQYVATSQTVFTGPDGSYLFEQVLPGTYQVVETQPDGFYSVGATAGSVGSLQRGVVSSADVISEIALSGGEGSTGNDFAEARPVALSGNVYHDADNDGTLDTDETGIGGVLVRVHYLPPVGPAPAPIELTTAADGSWSVGELMPGDYLVEEVQPDGYIDGLDAAGDAGGTANNPGDAIDDIRLLSGQSGKHYNFGELLPNSISGRVIADANGNCSYDPGETLLAGVTVLLRDGHRPHGWSGDVLATAETDPQGRYLFAGLGPGVYAVEEIQPAGYEDGGDHVGSAGGALLPPDSIVDIELVSDTAAVGYDFCEVEPVPPPDPPTTILNVIPPPEIIEPPPPPPPSLPPPLPPPPPPVYVPGYVPPPHVPFAAPAAVSLPPLQWPARPVQYVTPASRNVLLPMYGGGWLGFTAHDWYTWHLSVVNGGRPRRDRAPTEGYEPIADADNVRFHPASWMEVDVNRSQWILGDGEGRPAQQFQFGLTGGTPVTGDWNGDGASEIGVFLDGLWFLDLNGNGVWDDGDLWVRLGTVADTPVVGDWDGDGKSDVGVFGPAWPGDGRAVAAEPGLPDVANTPTGRYKNIPPEPTEATAGWRTMRRTSQGKLRSDVVDHVFEYGQQGDVAVAGDFNGDGVATIGIFRHGNWFLDVDGNGRWSPGDVHIERFGMEGDLPVVGDFNGDDIDDPGLYRDGTWYLDADGDRALTARDKVFRLGGPHDRPTVGDFDGDGIDEVAVYRDGVGASDAQAGSTPASRTSEVAASQSGPSSR